MKYTVIILFIILTSVSLYRCKTQKSTLSIEQKKSLLILEDLALKYTPRGIPNTGPDQLPPVHSFLENAVLSAYSIDSAIGERLIILIVIKLYKSHLMCCSQGYDLRRKNIPEPLDSLMEPIVYEFVRITNYSDLKQPIEFINSGLAYDWVEKNPALLKYKPIRSEFKIIEDLIEEINNSY